MGNPGMRNCPVDQSIVEEQGYPKSRSQDGEVFKSAPINSIYECKRQERSGPSVDTVDLVEQTLKHESIPITVKFHKSPRTIFTSVLATKKLSVAYWYS